MCVTKPLSRSVLHTSFTLTVYPREITTENETQERVVGTWTGVWVHKELEKERGQGSSLLGPRTHSLLLFWPRNLSVSLIPLVG